MARFGRSFPIKGVWLSKQPSDAAPTTAALTGSASAVTALRASVSPAALLNGTAFSQAGATASLTQQSTATSEPLLASASSTAFNTNTTPKILAGIAVQNGDVILAYGMMEAAAGDILSVSTSAGNTTSWTLLADVPAATTNNQSYLRAWSATATATGTISVAFASAGGLFNVFGGTVKVYRNSGGIGTVQTANNGTGSGLPSVTLTTTRDRSVLDFGSVDWNNAAGTATFTSSAGTPVEDLNIAMSGLYRVSSSHVNAGNAGSKTTGMSAPGGQRYVAVAIEVFGLGQVGSLVAKAGIAARGNSVFSGSTSLTGKAASTTRSAATFSGNAPLSGQTSFATRAGLFSQVVILAMQTRFLPAMRGVLTTTVSLGSDAGSVFRFTGKGEPSARSALAGKASAAANWVAGAAGATNLSGLAQSTSRAAATVAGSVILTIQTRFLPAMRGALDAAVVPTGVALSAAFAAMSRARATVAGRASLEGATNASSRATSGLSALTALAGRTASKATGAASAALRSALAAASAVRTASQGSMVGIVSLFGRATSSVAAMVTLPGTVVELVARATSATKIVAAMVSRTALEAKTSTAAKASAAAPLFTTALRGLTGIATTVRTGATAVTDIAVTARAVGMTSARAAFSGAVGLAGRTALEVKARIGEGFTPLLARTAARISAKALLFVLRPTIPTPTFPRPGRLSRLRASLEKAFGEEFAISPMTAAVDVNGRITPDISRDPLVDVIGIWQGPATSRAPIARGSMSDDKAHNWNVSFPSVRFDAAAVATVRKGDRLTRELDGSVWLVERVVPDGFGRTTLQLTSRKRESIN